MNSLLIKGVSKKYSSGVNALSNFSLELSSGELLVIAGVPGCGKSTALNIICGLESEDEGKIFISKISAKDLSPKERNVAIILPHFELYPNKSVYENLEFSLKVQHIALSDIKETINNTALELGISDMLDKMPAQLSKIEYFNALLARCVVKKPKILLIDEPFEDDDDEILKQKRHAILSLNKRLKLTTVIATSNSSEMLKINTKTLILKGGYHQQTDIAADILKNPVNIYAAQFLNKSDLTIAEAVLYEQDDRLLLKFESGIIEYVFLSKDKLKNYVNKEVMVGFINSRVSVVKDGSYIIQCSIEKIETENGEKHVTLKNKLFKIKVKTVLDFKEGESVGVVFDKDSVLLFDKDTGKKIA